MPAQSIVIDSSQDQNSEAHPEVQQALALASQPPQPQPPPQPSCLLVAYEAGGTGLQCTEAFWRSVPLLGAEGTVLQGAAPQRGSLRGNWQGGAVCSQHCLQKQRVHSSAFSPLSPSSQVSPGWPRPGVTGKSQDRRERKRPAFTRASCQTWTAAREHKSWYKG